MQTNTLTPEETIEALSAKCALLSASLNQAEAEGRKATHDAFGDLEDCANLFECHASWHFALFQAIEHYTDAGKYNMEALGIGERQTVAQLASIGVHMADLTYDAAYRYKKQTESARGAA